MRDRQLIIATGQKNTHSLRPRLHGERVFGLFQQRAEGDGFPFGFLGRRYNYEKILLDTFVAYKRFTIIILLVGRQ